MSKFFVRNNTSSWVPMPMQTDAPGCSVSSNGSSSQIAASNALTRVNFDGAEYRDTNGYHSAASNPSKITVPNITSLSGLYTLSARVEFDDNKS